MLTLLLSLQVKGENEPHSRHGFAGTPCYMSPEVEILCFLNQSRVKTRVPYTIASLVIIQPFINQ